MIKLHHIYIILCVAMLALLAACSTTKNLPEGQQLYTGQKSTKVENRAKGAVPDEAMAEIEAALDKSPNNALIGSTSLRKPFPFGLWTYNAFVHKEKGMGKWMFKHFAATPIYISTVNPEVRAKIATNLLHDYGFFSGTVKSEVITNPKNPKKAKVQYTIDMQTPYIIDTIMYEHFNPEMSSIIQRSMQRTNLHKGDQFNIIALENERARVATQLRNRGFYYFRSDYLTYRADTTRMSGLVDLQILPKPGLPAEAKRKYYIGDIDVYLYGVKGEEPNDSISYEDIMIHYYNKLDVRPKVLANRFRFQEGQLYSQMRTARTQERFAELGIFRFTEMQFTPRDTIATNDTLNVAVRTRMDLPYDSELELNMAFKSNDYAGPGMAYGVTRRNVFKGGETFNVRLKGSYEWQTKSSGGSGAKVNSYELGLSTSLSFPRVVFPRLGKKEYDFPATTKFGLSVDQLNRASYFKMLSFGGDATYVFQPTRVSKHSITPFRLTFNTLQSTTAVFDSIMEVKRSLKQSMENQFIPAMSYTYTYDDASVRRRRNHFWWQSTLTSSGNVTSGLYAMSGKKFNEEKKLMGASMAQFLKLTSEVRYTWAINRDQSLASRVMMGGIYAYGDRKIAPYSEQFFIGGANSIRAFTVRSIGPGKFRPKEGDRYGYMDQTGDFKLEANLEYRFRIVSDLHGALFLDAGNIWLLRDDAEREGGKISPGSLLNNMALGTGTGLRYDLSFLIIRLDCGIGLHVPYKTEKSGFYNIPSFKDGFGLHLAVGYPF